MDSKDDVNDLSKDEKLEEIDADSVEDDKVGGTTEVVEYDMTVEGLVSAVEDYMDDDGQVEESETISNDVALDEDGLDEEAGTEKVVEVTGASVPPLDEEEEEEEEEEVVPLPEPVVATVAVVPTTTAASTKAKEKKKNKKKNKDKEKTEVN